MCVQIFTLPKVSAKMKLKLTALDGSRVRRVGVAWFGSSRSAEAGESGLVVLTNQGDLNVVSLPAVKMQVQHPCIRREDVSGIASCVFTKHGQGEPPHAAHQGSAPIAATIIRPYLRFFPAMIYNRVMLSFHLLGGSSPAETEFTSMNQSMYY